MVLSVLRFAFFTQKRPLQFVCLYKMRNLNKNKVDDTFMLWYFDDKVIGESCFIIRKILCCLGGIFQVFIRVDFRNQN